MRILLTGASGRIGRAVRRGIGFTHHLRLLDVADEVLKHGGVRASVADKDAVCRAAEGCDAILHLATINTTSLRGDETNSEFLKTETVGADNLFQAALLHGIRRVVVASSIMVYFDHHLNFGAAELDENLPPRPGSLYSLNKVLVEQIGRYYAGQHGLEVVQLRYCGVSDDPLAEIAFGLLARRMAASDAVRAAVAALTTPGLRDEVFCIGPGSPLRQQDGLDAQKNPWIVLERHWPGCTRALRPYRQWLRKKDFFPVVRSDKARLMMGWTPRYRFDTFLRSLGWLPKQLTRT